MLGLRLIKTKKHVLTYVKIKKNKNKMSAGKTVFTSTLTASSVTVAASSGKSSISISWLSGTVVITGVGSMNGVAASAITWTTANSMSFVLSDGSIDSLTINATAGSCAIIAQ